MTIKMFQNKKLIMKFTQLLVSIWMVLIFSSCLKDPNTLSPVQSESFHEKLIQLHFQPSQTVVQDSLRTTLSQEQNLVIKELDQMHLMVEQILQSRSDSLWATLTKKWTEFNINYIGTHQTIYSGDDSSTDSLKNTLFPEAALKWAQLNVDLVKLSGEVRFGDALEVMLYGGSGVALPEDLLKSVIVTHVSDKIYINIIGSSSMEYQHTTGGTVKLIQQTNYPKSNEMTLMCETNDVRYMDVFIRIPSWAVNPLVSHGNVKYVARPGEYCEISKKWRTGDEIRVVLRN